MDQVVSFSPQAFTNPERFYISSIGITYPEKNYYRSRRETVEYSFAFIISGKGYFDIDGGQRVTVNAGDTTILPAGISYKAWSDQENPQYKIWMAVGGSLCNALYSSYGLGPNISFQYPRTGTLLHRLYDECHTNRGNPEYLAVRGALFMHELFASIALNETVDNSTQYRYARAAKNFIDQNLTKHISMEMVAHDVGISISHLNRTFTAKYGITPAAYYLQCRIDMAQALLLHTDIPIKKIAQQLGFSSERYFSDCFQRKCGTCPRKYRSTHIG